MNQTILHHLNQAQAIATQQALSNNNEVRTETLPFESEAARLNHEVLRRAQGWEASYKFIAKDDGRDVYEITQKKLVF